MGYRDFYAMSRALDEPDELRKSLLSRRGYVKLNVAEHQWRRDLDLPVPDALVAPGYTIRSLGDGLELLDAATHRGWAFMKKGLSCVLHYLVR